MNAVTAFEHRREQLLKQLEDAKDVQQAALTCTMALEQIASELAQDEPEEIARQKQQAVMAVVRRVPGILQACRAKGEMVISGQEDTQQMAADAVGFGLRIAGVLALCGLAVYEYASGRTAAALIQALGALLFTAGLIRMRPEPLEAKGKVRGIACVDAMAVVSQIAQLCEAADVCVQDLQVVQASGAQARLSGTADEAMLDLLVALMEAKASGRDEMAMRSLSLAEEYLHMLGVEIVFYEAEQAALFDTLPTMGAPRTIRPALLKNGKLLRRGVAAVAMERGMGV